MDKEEYRIKLEEISQLAESGDFHAAANAADSVDWKHVKSVRTLCMVGEIYESEKRYEDAVRVLKFAYRRASISKTVLYRLCLLSLKVGDIEGAKNYCSEFEEISPHDSSKYIMRYRIAKADRAPVADRIRILQEYKEKEYTERWAYELARLYKKSGQDEKCVEECDDMILWFSEGKYVIKAMELKQQITALTPDQQRKYDAWMEAENARRLAYVPVMPVQPPVVHVNEELQQTAPIPVPLPTLGLDTMPENAAEVRQEFSAENRENVQERLADSIRAVFSGMIPPRTEDVPAEESGIAEPAEEAPMAFRVPALEPEGTEGVVDTGAQAEEEQQMTLDDFAPSSESEEADLERLLAETKSEFASAVASGDYRMTDEPYIEDEPETPAEEVRAEAPEAEPVQEEEPAVEAEPEAEAETPAEAVAPAAALSFEAAEEPVAEAVAESPVMEQVEEPLHETVEEYAEPLVEEYAEPVTEAFPEPEPEAAATAEEPAVETPVAEEPAAEAVDEPAAEEAAAEYTPEAAAAAALAAAASAAAVETVEEYAAPVAEEYAEPAAEAVTEPEAAEEPAAEAVPETEIPSEEAQIVEEAEAAEAIIETIEETPAGPEAAAEPETPAEPEAAAEPEAPAEPEIDPLYDKETDETLGLTREFNFSQELKKAMSSGESLSEAAKRVSQMAEAAPVAAAAQLPIPEELQAELSQAEELSEEIASEEDLPEELFASEEELRASALEPDSPAAEDLSADFTEAGSVDQASKSIIDDIMERPEVLHKVPVEPRRLDETEKKIFSYFSPIPGMGEQITETIADVHNNAGDKTSRGGNILLIGRQGAGKTHLADSLILSICRDLNIKGARIAHIVATDFNQKDPAQIVAKLAGGFLVIEGSGSLSDDAVNKLLRAMEFRTDGLVVILEDEKRDLLDLIRRHPEIREKFTSNITIPVFTNDELVTFAKTYAKECGYKMDEMAVLALYTMIGDNQKDSEPVTVGKVKDMMDQAISRAEKGTRRFGRKLSKKSVFSDGRIMLFEKDFEF